jgi:hypothetical protein
VRSIEITKQISEQRAGASVKTGRAIALISAVLFSVVLGRFRKIIGSTA